MKKRFLIFCVLIFAAPHGYAQVVENFDHGSRSASSGSCWQIQNGDVGTVRWGIHSLTDAPLFISSVLAGTTAQIVSPYVKFNGTGVISFNHIVNDLSSDPRLDVFLVDTSGNVVQNLLTHNYSSSGALSEDIVIQWSGIYQVVWEWSGTGGSSRAGLDDVSIHGSYAADPSQNNLGDCPAMKIPDALICAGAMDVPYNIYMPNSGSTYHWYLSDNTAGRIDFDITASNDQIEIDWGTATGNYQLYVYEVSADGCIGDTVEMNIKVLPLPTVNITVDSICEGDSPVLDLSLTGTAPWIITLSDGSATYLDTCATSTCSMELQSYSSNTTIEVISIEDGSGCLADTAIIPPAMVYIFSRPATGLIYH